MSLISVIVPVYKVESYLKRCVDSILAQSFQDFEVILVEDGSPDNCPVICDEYALIDNRIHVIHQDNRGLSAARNAGLDYVFSRSDSEWITFVDSDDWILEDYLKDLYSAVVALENDVSVCCYETSALMNRKNDVECEKVHNICFEDLYNLDNVKMNPITAWGKLYKKVLFRDIRFPIGKINEDLYVVHQVLYLCNSISFVEKPLYVYFTGSESIMRSSWTKKRYDEIHGYEELIVFLEKRNLSRALKGIIRRYIVVLHGQLIQINNSDNRDQLQNDVAIIRKKLRKNLWKYKKEAPFASNKWHYEAAYPKLMNYYWIISGKLKKQN